ncbi:MAG: hypothetical protein ACYDCH_13545 [Gaiellaceae bacterium]
MPLAGAMQTARPLHADFSAAGFGAAQLSVNLAGAPFWPLTATFVGKRPAFPPHSFAGTAVLYEQRGGVVWLRLPGPVIDLLVAATLQTTLMVASHVAADTATVAFGLPLIGVTQTASPLQEAFGAAALGSTRPTPSATRVASAAQPARCCRVPEVHCGFGAFAAIERRYS